jgi:hypothetical protein
MARSRKLGYGEGSIYQQRDGRWRGELRLGTRRRRVSGPTRSDVVRKPRLRFVERLPRPDEIARRHGPPPPWPRGMMVPEPLARRQRHRRTAGHDVSSSPGLR